MPEIISNTSCLIVLDNIDMIYILKELYETITISKEVAEEYGKELPEWVSVKSVYDKKSVRILSSFVDLGEASTIALCIEIENSIMILDDMKARKLAKKLDMKFTGTIGVLIKARELGIIDDCMIVISRLKECGFRVPPEIEKLLLSDEK